MPLLEVRDLKTHFHTKRGVVKAVNGVSFTVDEGETLGLVGESGSGKTITGLSVLRLVPEPAGRIVGGQVLFNGEDLLRKSKTEMQRYRGKHLSIILQDPMSSLNPVLTIGYQVGEGVILHQGAKWDKTLWEIVSDLMRQVRIPAPESRLSDYTHQYSGGMRQRIVGAIAIACQPHLLIADEPTTALDVTIQAQYLNLLKEIQKQRKLSMLFITHDFGVVAKMCTKVAVMYAGRIVEMAEVRQIFNHPSHPYTKGLMLSVPKVDQEVERLFSIEGHPPDLTNLSSQCSFLPRCIEKMEVCGREEFPPEVNVGDGHVVRCWRYV